MSWLFVSVHKLSAQVTPTGAGSTDLRWNWAASKAAFSAGSVTHVPSEFFRGEIELAFVGLFKSSLLYFHHCFDDLGNDKMRSFNDCRYDTNALVKIRSHSNSFVRNSSDQAAAHLACTAAMHSASSQGWLQTLVEITRRGIRRMQQVSM